MEVRALARMNDRDRRFVDEYLVDFDAKNAAIRAGFSPKTAKDAYKWVDAQRPKKPAVRAEIERAMARASRRTGVTVERILEELARIAFSDITDVADADGKLLEGIDRADAAAVMSVRVKRGDDFTENEVRMYDKLRALELLGKRFGMFTDKVRLDGPVPVIIDDASEEAPEAEPEKKVGFA